MKKSGRRIHPDDMPPPLLWERPIWELYIEVETQWRYRTYGFDALRSGLDYGPAIEIAKESGWSVRRTLRLLNGIERVVIERDRALAKQS